MRTPMGRALSVVVVAPVRVAQVRGKSEHMKESEMNRRLGVLGSAALAAVIMLSSSAMAGQGGNVPRVFVEEPGVLEFSDQMIARPVQGDAARRDMAIAHLQQRYEIRFVERLVDHHVFRLPQGADVNDVAQGLMNTGLYEFVEPDWICYPMYTPNDTRFGELWNMAKIQATTAWNYNTGFSGITVGICDTGLRTSHLDLPPLRKLGYNAVDQLWENNGGNIGDIHGHGTHVTGTAAAAGNNARGVCGVGWEYAHRILKVSNLSGGGSNITTLNHAALTSAEQGDKAINTSYSGVNNDSVRTTATAIKALGGLSFWAAGNSNQNMSSPHRDADDVMVVGSTDENDAKSSFSNYGLYVDLFAPGSNILSLSNAGDNEYTTMSGTSMASPCATGLAALIWSQNPSFTPSEVEALMKATCDNVGNSNTFGYGRINAAKAMQATGRKSVGTTWAGGNGQNGAMFDVTCLNANGINLTAFDFNNLTPGATNIEIWYVTDKTTYVGKEANQALWTLLGTQTGLAPAPEGYPSPINIGGLTLAQGQTCGIYVTRTDGGTIRYTNGPTRAYENPDLRIENRGVGKAYPFGSTFANRVWNGSVHYRPYRGGILPTTSHAAYNFIPFGSAQTCTQHQVFNRNLFSGPVIMESIGFAPNTGDIGDTHVGNVTIRMGYTNKIPGAETGAGGLDAVLANNPSGAMTTMFTGTGVRRTIMTNGTIEHSMFFDFGNNSFTYNPANGNLLVEIVSVNSGSEDTSVSRSTGSSESSRAYNSDRFGNANSPTTATRMDLGWRPTTIGPFTIGIAGPCPGTVRISWSNATPNATLALIFASNTGSFRIPFGPCEGTILGLGNRNIQLVNTFPSGSNGAGTVNGNAGAFACGGFIQMHEIPSCIISNVVQVPN